MSNLINGNTNFPNSMIMDSNLSNGEYRVLSALKMHCFNKDNCFVGIKRLCSYVNRSYRQIERYLKSLEQKGYIEVTHQKGFVNIYKILKGVMNAIKNAIKNKKEDSSNNFKTPYQPKKNYFSDYKDQRKYNVKELEKQLLARSREGV